MNHTFICPCIFFIVCKSEKSKAWSSVRAGGWTGNWTAGRGGDAVDKGGGRGLARFGWHSVLLDTLFNNLLPLIVPGVLTGRRAVLWTLTSLLTTRRG